MLKLLSHVPTAPIRIVLVEPYALVRAALREMVDREEDVEIVAEERSISGAIDALRDSPPDVILVDTDVESARLVAALQQLKRECPGSAIVLLGHRHDDTELFWAIQAGAAAHVSDVI